MGVAKAALESVNRYLARDLGRAACARTSSSAGPLRTHGRALHPRLRASSPTAWERGAPLGWDPRDPSARRRRVPVPAVGLWRGRSPARSSTWTAATTRWARPSRPPGARGVRRAWVDRAPPQLRQSTRTDSVTWRPPRMISMVTWRSTIAHSAWAPMRGSDVVGGDAALLVAPDAPVGAGHEAADVGLPLGRQVVARARRAGRRAGTTSSLALTTPMTRASARRSSQRAARPRPPGRAPRRRACRRRPLDEAVDDRALVVEVEVDGRAGHERAPRDPVHASGRRTGLLEQPRAPRRGSRPRSRCAAAAPAAGSGPARSSSRTLPAPRRCAAACGAAR